MQKEFKLKRASALFNPVADTPFKVSRSGIESFVQCPRCFILDRVHGIRQPSGAPFTLNCLVDTLLKKEFDLHRAAGTPHPLMVREGIDAIPFPHPMLDEWRQNFKGMGYLHEPTNLWIRGAIDDLWVSPAGEVIVVDYKATSSATKEPSPDDDWKIQYKRQADVYQWLARRQGLKVSDTAYFVYANGLHLERFDECMHFSMSVLPYVGNDAWVESKIFEIDAALRSGVVPPATLNCEHCGYVNAMVGMAACRTPDEAKQILRSFQNVC